MPSRTVDHVCMFPSQHIHETIGIFDGLVCVAVRLQVQERRTAITDDRSAGFDPVTKNIH